MSSITDPCDRHIQIRRPLFIILLHFSCFFAFTDDKHNRTFNLNVSIVFQETGKSSRELHGYKHNQCSASLEYRYQSHHLTENQKGRLLTITRQNAGGVTAVYHMQFFTGLSAVQVWVSLSNGGTQDVPLEYVSSFVYQNLCGGGRLPYYEKTDIFSPRNSWYMEARWQKCDARDLNLTGIYYLDDKLSRVIAFKSN